MSGMIMYPQSMRKKAGEMLKGLGKMDRKIEGFFEKYDEVENEKRLLGKSWLSVKNYITDVQKPYLRGYKAWNEEQKEALQLYSNAAQNLPDVHKLNKDQMENTIRRSQRAIDRQLNRENPNENVIRYHEEIIAELSEKIERMDDFISVTAGIFEEANSMQAVLVSMNRILNRARLPKGETEINYTRVIESEEMKTLIVIANIQYMIDSGVTKERIEELEDLGFNKRELSNIYEMSKAAGEKDLIIHFIKGDYREAFLTVDRKEGFTGSTATFIVNYLYSLDKKKDTDKEIENIINAIFEEKEDVVDVSRAISCVMSLQATTKKLVETDCAYAITWGRFMNDDEYEELGNRVTRLNSIEGLYASIASIMSDSTIGYEQYRFNYAKVTELTYNTKTQAYKYHIKYNGIGGSDDYHTDKYTLGREIVLDNNVSTYMVIDSHVVAREIDYEFMKKVEFKKEQLKIDVIDDGIFAISAVAPTSIIGGVGMGAIAIKKAFSGSYSKLRNATMDILKQKGGIEKILSKLPMDLVGITKAVLVVSQDYQDKMSFLDEVSNNHTKREEASFSYIGNGYEIEGKGVDKIVSSGICSLDTAGALESWMNTEVNIKGYGIRDLKLGHILKDPNVMNQKEIDEFGEWLDENIKKKKYDRELKDVWDGNIDIDEIPIDRLYKDIDKLSRLSREYLALKGKIVDIRYGDAISRYNHNRSYYEEDFR